MQRSNGNSGLVKFAIGAVACIKLIEAMLEPRRKGRVVTSLENAKQCKGGAIRKRSKRRGISRDFLEREMAIGDDAHRRNYLDNVVNVSHRE